VQAVVEGEVLLAGELRGPVRRERTPWRVLRGRRVALAVDRAARRGEDDPRAVAGGGVQHADGPDDVDLGVEGGPLDGHAHVGLRGEVEARLRPHFVKDGVDCVPVTDVGDRQADVLVEVLAPPAREVVDDQHLVSAGDERVDDVRADEAGSPCHDRPHSALS
jgi:hypothetical protein